MEAEMGVYSAEQVAEKRKEWESKCVENLILFVGMMWMENSDGKLVVKATNQKERVSEREREESLWFTNQGVTRMKEKLSTTGHFCRALNSTVVGVRWDNVILCRRFCNFVYLKTTTIGVVVWEKKKKIDDNNKGVDGTHLSSAFPHIQTTSNF